MKQIISFEKELKFNTRVSEICSISLEHNYSRGEDGELNGEFYVNGDYKISDISVNKESFDFKIPFNIDLDRKYNTSRSEIEIDDFYYELVNNEALKVNIDILIDNIEEAEERVETPKEEKAEAEFPEEIIEKYDEIEEYFNEKKDNEIEEKIEELEVNENERIKENNIEEQIEDNQIESEEIEEVDTKEIIEEVDLEEQYDDKEINDKESLIMENDSEDTRDIEDLFKELDTDVPVMGESKADLKNIFENDNETFVTYHVHIVRENDTLETICAKYNITKEELSDYNDLNEIILGNKIIVPVVKNEKDK